MSMQGYHQVKVIGEGAFGAAYLVKKDKDLFVRKEVVIKGMSAKVVLWFQGIGERIGWPP